MKTFVSIVMLSATLLTQPAWSREVDKPELFTGVMFILVGVTSHDGGAPATLGTLTLFSAFGVFGGAHAANLTEDQIKAVQKSPEYLNLEKAIGKAKAREFVLDVKAGWTLEALQKKYGFTVSEKMMAQANTKAQASKAAAQNEEGRTPASSNVEAK